MNVFKMMAIAIAILTLCFAPVYKQGERSTNITETQITTDNPVIIANPAGEAVRLESGHIRNSWHQVIMGDVIHIAWKYQIVASGVSTVTGMTYRVNEESPYDFMGNVDGFNYSSRDTMMLQGGPTGHTKIRFDYHAQWDGTTLTVLVDNYTVKPN